MWTWAWTANWTVLAFVLLLVHGDAILASPPTSSTRAAPTGCSSNKNAPSKPS
jgi:hypothetical protein